MSVLAEFAGVVMGDFLHGGGLALGKIGVAFRAALVFRLLTPEREHPFSLLTGVVTGPPGLGLTGCPDVVAGGGEHSLCPSAPVSRGRTEASRLRLTHLVGLRLCLGTVRVDRTLRSLLILDDSGLGNPEFGLRGVPALLDGSGDGTPFLRGDASQLGGGLLRIGDGPLPKTVDPAGDRVAQTDETGVGFGESVELLEGRIAFGATPVRLVHRDRQLVRIGAARRCLPGNRGRCLLRCDVVLGPRWDLYRWTRRHRRVERGAQRRLRGFRRRLPLLPSVLPVGCSLCGPGFALSLAAAVLSRTITAPTSTDGRLGHPAERLARRVDGRLPSGRFPLSTRRLPRPDQPGDSGIACQTLESDQVGGRMWSSPRAPGLLGLRGAALTDLPLHGRPPLHPSSPRRRYAAHSSSRDPFGHRQGQTGLPEWSAGSRIGRSAPQQVGGIRQQQNPKAAVQRRDRLLRRGSAT
ncbi:hypothetical protein ILP97_37780 [Amycolatopsis sp. H6(2020)]|nr:hypothetical protein [Amycolatopsis sp. H6(2020)]